MLAGERGVDLFAEYLDDPATTDRSFVTNEHGVTWFLTGDLAVETAEGALRSDAPTTSSRSPGRTSASPRSKRSSPKPQACSK